MSTYPTEAFFRSAYIAYCENGGHRWDKWDIAWAWKNYQKHPEKYKHLIPEVKPRA